jgi:hypothetical protein
MIQLAWRFVRFQKNSALAQWFAARTADGRASTRKTMMWRWRGSCSSPSGVSLRGARFRRASCYVRRHERQQGKRATTGQTAWQPRARDLPINPRWRCPDVKPWLQKPLCRMGPPPRSFADDAHDCIVVAIRTWIDRIQGCGATFCAPMASSPRIRSCRSSGCKTTHVGERRAPTIAINSASNSAE